MSDPWIRLLPGDLPAAGYFVLHNDSSRGVTLVGAAAPDFERVELHRSVERDSLETMEPVDSIEVQAHGKLQFRPGGYHLMLMQPRRPLSVGDVERVTFSFEDGTELAVDFDVLSATGERLE